MLRTNGFALTYAENAVLITSSFACRYEGGDERAQSCHLYDRYVGVVCLFLLGDFVELAAVVEMFLLGALVEHFIHAEAHAVC
jgi:hypothetical protein